MSDTAPLLTTPRRNRFRRLPSTLGAVLALSLVVTPLHVSAADEWSTEQQRAAWREWLEAESLGNASSAILFNEVGNVAGLHGDFPVPNFHVTSIQNWIYAHRQMLGLLPNELVDLDEKYAFYEALPDGPENVVNAQTGIVFSFSIVLSGVKAGRGTFKVIADKRTGTIRGLYSSYEPTTQGLFEPDVSYTEGKAWEAVESYLGAPILHRTSAGEVWSSVGWLTERTPKKKQLLWVLRGETSAGNVESFIVAPSGVLHQEGGLAWLGGPVPQVHHGYDVNQPIYWQTSGVGGCSALGPGCTNPALNDSLVSRIEVPLFAQFWSTLSSQNWTGSYLDWPWKGADQAPLRSVQAKAVDGRSRTLRVIVAYPGGVCAALGGIGAPCSDYSTIYMGVGDTSTAIYGHEMGHNIVRDLKNTVHSQNTFGDALRANSLTEAMCDYIGVVQEDFRLKADNPNPSAPRTQFRLVAPSSGIVVDWNLASCQPSSGARSARGALGYAWLQAWKRMGAYTVAHARRDVLFRAWQASIAIAYYFTTDYWPFPRDMAAAHLAMVPTPLYSFGPNQPYPNTLLAQEVIMELSPGCW
jgi:hypothetical protein